MDQMTADQGSWDDGSIEEKLIDQVADAIGGEGSLTLVSGGSVAQRHAVIVRVLEEAEGMGCLTMVLDLSRKGNGTEPLTDALVALASGSDGNDRNPFIIDGRSEMVRSYRREMATLDILRSVTNENAVIIALEELGMADRDTIDIFLFLARNIQGMNALIIATHPAVDEDRFLVDAIESISGDVLVHDLHLHAADGTGGDKGQIRHDAVSDGAGMATSLSLVAGIEEQLLSSTAALSSADVAGAVGHAERALQDSIAIDHYGLVLDSYMALGTALTQAGMEKEALDALDRALGLAVVVGERPSQHLARVRRSELLLFSVGEPDSALVDAISALDLWSMSSGATSRIEPLALAAIIESRNGRRDRAEKAFCDASGMLEAQPTDSLILERMLLALAAALLLETRYDLGGMNARYAEARVLATGTDSPHVLGGVGVAAAGAFAPEVQATPGGEGTSGRRLPQVRSSGEPGSICPGQTGGGRVRRWDHAGLASGPVFCRLVRHMQRCLSAGFPRI